MRKEEKHEQRIKSSTQEPESEGAQVSGDEMMDPFAHGFKRRAAP